MAEPEFKLCHLLVAYDFATMNLFFSCISKNYLTELLERLNENIYLKF